MDIIRFGGSKSECISTVKPSKFTVHIAQSRGKSRKIRSVLLMVGIAFLQESWTGLGGKGP